MYDGTKEDPGVEVTEYISSENLKKGFAFSWGMKLVV